MEGSDRNHCNIIPDMGVNVLGPHPLIDIGHLIELSFIKEGRKRIRIRSPTTIPELASSEVIQKLSLILLLRTLAASGGDTGISIKRLFGEI